MARTPEEREAHQAARVEIAARSYAVMSGDPDWDGLDDAARDHYRREISEVLADVDAFDAKVRLAATLAGKAKGARSGRRKLYEYDPEGEEWIKNLLFAGVKFLDIHQQTGYGFSTISRILRDLKGAGHVLVNRPARGRRPGVRVPVPDEGSGAEAVSVGAGGNGRMHDEHRDTRALEHQ